jgi:acetyltransferase-like isoleucine patch superfamily enzyme
MNGRRYTLLIVLSVLLSTFALPAVSAAPTNGENSTIASSIPDGVMINSPMMYYFTVNQGQLDHNISFTAKTSFGSAIFFQDGYSYSLLVDNTTSEVISFIFVNAHKVAPIGTSALSHHTNYIYGSVGAAKPVTENNDIRSRTERIVINNEVFLLIIYSSPPIK